MNPIEDEFMKALDDAWNSDGDPCKKPGPWQENFKKIDDAFEFVWNRFSGHVMKGAKFTFDQICALFFQSGAATTTHLTTKESIDSDEAADACRRWLSRSKVDYMKMKDDDIHTLCTILMTAGGIWHMTKVKGGEGDQWIRLMGALEDTLRVSDLKDKGHLFKEQKSEEPEIPDSLKHRIPGKRPGGGFNLDL